MSTIMDMFRTAIGGTPAQPAQQQQTPGAGNPGNMPTGAGTQATQQNAATAGNGVVPASGAPQTPASSESKTPLDSFTDIWKNDPASGKSDEPFSFNVDPQKLMEAAGKIDFAQVVGPDSLAKIAAGGEGAAAAFAEALNKVTQTAFAQSALASSKMVEQAVAKTRESMESSIPGLIKQQTLSNTLREENPAFSHPAAAPVIAALESQLRVKYPNATVTELKDLANNYFSSLGEAFNQPKVAAANAAASKAKGDVDWDAFLN